jgi:hypothetical protein
VNSRGVERSGDGEERGERENEEVEKPHGGCRQETSR